MPSTCHNCEDCTVLSKTSLKLARGAFKEKPRVLACALRAVVAECQEKMLAFSEQSLEDGVQKAVASKGHSFFAGLPALTMAGRVVGPGRNVNRIVSFESPRVALGIVSEIVEARSPDLLKDIEAPTVSVDMFYVILHFLYTDKLPRLKFSYKVLWGVFKWSLQTTKKHHRLQHLLSLVLRNTPATDFIDGLNFLFDFVQTTGADETTMECAKSLYEHMKLALKVVSFNSNLPDNINLHLIKQAAAVEVLLHDIRAPLVPCKEPSSTFSADMKALQHKGTGDLCVVYDRDGKDVQLLHKSILGCSSDYFARFANKTTINAHEWLPEDIEQTEFHISATKQVISYLYTGEIGTITPENAVTIFMIADYFLMDMGSDLCCMCKEVIIENMDESSSGYIWNSLVSYREDSENMRLLRQACLMNKPKL